MLKAKYQSVYQFLWQVIKPYKWLYAAMLSAPILSAFYDFANNYALKLVIDAFSLRLRKGPGIGANGRPDGYSDPVKASDPGEPRDPKLVQELLHMGNRLCGRAETVAVF